MRKVIVLLAMAILLPSLGNAQDFWQQSNGPHTGDIRNLVINSNGHIFAPASAGVYRSTDHGKNWELTGLTDTGVMSLAIRANGDLFAGTTDGVYRSTDNGDSWTRLELPTVVGISLAINSSDHIFVGTFDSGIFRSTDNGDNWLPIGLEDYNVRSLAINSIGHVFAGTYDSGVFRSANDGENWTPVHAGLTNPMVSALAVSPSGYLCRDSRWRSVSKCATNYFYHRKY